MIFDFVRLPGRLPIVPPNRIVYLLFYLFLGHSTGLWGPFEWLSGGHLSLPRTFPESVRQNIGFLLVRGFKWVKQFRDSSK